MNPNMNRYLFLLHPDATAGLATMASAEKAELFARFVTWTESLKARGVLDGVESLMDDGGTTIRKRRDAIVVDGPYAEVKEMVSGLFVVRAADGGAAGRIASECPLLDHGGAVEVREIYPFPVRP